jgi:hypothetical protein
VGAGLGKLFAELIGETVVLRGVHEPMNTATKSRSLWIAILVLVLASAFVLAFLFKRRYDKAFWTRTTVAQVRADLDQHVPPGSPREAVAAYLDARKIAHAYYGADIYKNTRYYNCEVALLPNTASSWLVTTDIQIVFRFDSASRLLSYGVQEVYKGP